MQNQLILADDAFEVWEKDRTCNKIGPQFSKWNLALLGILALLASHFDQLPFTLSAIIF
jgi:hypothetical protein